MTIEIDLHGSSVKGAIYMIQRAIVDNPNCVCIRAIHGFNNGSKIKNAIRDPFNIHNRRVKCVYPEPRNEGVTLIHLK